MNLLSLLSLSASWINMAVLPRCPVILGFSNMKYCNPGFNLILPQLTKSSSLCSYQSFGLHSSLWGCHPCGSSLRTLLLPRWLEHLVLGAVLVPLPVPVVMPGGNSLTASNTVHHLFRLLFCSLQVDQLWWTAL